jgi:hypothetical protein
MKTIRNYKIRVGIDEFPIQEADVPRVVQAMQTNEIVKLDCGMIRGQAILAVLKDEVSVAEERDLTLEERAEMAQIEARKSCLECKGIGYVKGLKDGRPVMMECKCQKISLPAVT